MNNSLSQNLKKLRKDNNLSQEDLAEKLGVSRQSISKWESNQAYPEMDKIIQLANMFNVSIDDLLNNDIREVNKEKESKKAINNYIDDFLKFLTNTVDLITNISLKSRIKCLIEQVIVAIILYIIFAIFGNIISSLFLGVFDGRVYDILQNIFGIIYNFIALLLSIIIMVHLFKTRYLDYYDELIENTKEETNKVEIKDKEPKVIIRDPKHSEYRFVNGLIKLVVLFFKFIVLCIAFSFCFGLLCSAVALVLSFLVAKTGLFFFGILLTCLVSLAIHIVILIVLFNFVFSRKSNIKYLLIIFISSILIGGIGCGMWICNLATFDISSDIEYKNEEKIIPMSDDLIIHLNYVGENIKFIEEDRNDIKIGYQSYKYCNIEFENYDRPNSGYNMLYYNTHCEENYMKMGRDILKQINNKKIPVIDETIRDIKIYTSKENIEILKNNIKRYEDE